MPEICHFYGIVITMYLPDHNPPHFHVRYNEYRAIIDIQTGKVTGQMTRRALHLVFEWLDLHKANSWRTGSAWRTARHWQRLTHLTKQYGTGEHFEMGYSGTHA